MSRMESPNRTTTASVQLTDDRLERLEEYAEENDLSKSEVLRRGIDAVTESSVDDHDGRVPPAEDDLRKAYLALKRLSNGGEAWVREDRAARHLAQQVSNYSKETVYGGLLKPLSKRGYVRLSTDPTGHSSSVFVRE